MSKGDVMCRPEPRYKVGDRVNIPSSNFRHKKDRHVIKNVKGTIKDRMFEKDMGEWFYYVDIVLDGFAEDWFEEFELEPVTEDEFFKIYKKKIDKKDLSKAPSNARIYYYVKCKECHNKQVLYSCSLDKKDYMKVDGDIILDFIIEHTYTCGLKDCGITFIYDVLEDL